MPHVIAGRVIGELEMCLRVEIPASRNLVAKLAGRSERLYLANRHRPFGRNLRGHNGREYLYAFMRHWLSAELARDPIGERIPDDFKRGLEVEPRARLSRKLVNRNSLTKPKED